MPRTIETLSALFPDVDREVGPRGAEDMTCRLPSAAPWDPVANF